MDPRGPVRDRATAAMVTGLRNLQGIVFDAGRLPDAEALEPDAGAPPAHRKPPAGGAGARREGAQPAPRGRGAAGGAPPPPAAPGGGPAPGDTSSAV